MQDLARIVGLILAGLLLVLLLAAGGIYAVSEHRLNQHLDVPADTLTVPTDITAMQRGQHLSSAVARCIECHGANLAGRVLFDDSSIGRIVAPNLTRGRGGVGSTFSAADFVHAIRYGVDPSGRPLLLMPSDDYNRFSDADLADIIAYVKSVAPVDTALPTSEIRPFGRALFALGRLDLLPVESIDTDMPRPPMPTPGVSAEYGAYLAVAAGCPTCHGPGLAGGKIPQAPPGTPPASNLTPAGIGGWSEADFVRAMRTGVTPDGRRLNTYMPWPYYAQMTDDELRALKRFLEAVPPLLSGQ